MTISLRIILFVLLPGLVACGRASSPTVAPSPVPSPAPRPQPIVEQSLYGSVEDTAYRPIVGAQVDVVDGPRAGLSMTTDADGRFSYTGTFESPITFRASKAGYVADSQASHTSSPGGRPWVLFHLDVTAPPVNIAGEYKLTLTIDGACTGFPAGLGTRTYDATIAPGSNPAGRPETQFNVAVSGTGVVDRFRGFTIGVAGDAAGLVVYDGENPGLVEEVAPKTYLALYGFGAASVAAGSIVSTSFDSLVEYCVLNSELGPYYDCPAPVARAQCQSRNNQLTLTRR